MIGDQIRAPEQMLVTGFDESNLYVLMNIMTKIKKILDFWFEGIDDSIAIDLKNKPFKKWFIYFRSELFLTNDLNISAHSKAGVPLHFVFIRDQNEIKMKIGNFLFTFQSHFF